MPAAIEVAAACRAERTPGNSLLTRDLVIFAGVPAMYPNKGISVGFPGKDIARNAFQSRKILIASGAALAVLAVTAWAFISLQGPSAVEPVADAAQAPATTPTPTATQSPAGDRAADRADRGTARKPVRKPVAKPKKKRAVHRTKKTGTRVLSSGSCQASFYGEGQMTANGESFNPGALTAAHKTLPFGSRVRVTNRNNGRSVVVRINDRGPFIAGRCIDLSTAAMRAVGGVGSGVIPVRYAVLARG